MIFLYDKGFELESEMHEKGSGLVFVVSAPSGTGKTTLIREVIKQLPCLQFSVSYTTRLPRPHEKEGEDYYFVSHTVFQKMVEKDKFLEWAEVLGNRYGTPRPDLKKLEADGMDLVLDIDTQGAKKIKKELTQSILIFLFPPSLKVLKERLIERGDSLEMIKFRSSNARKELQEAQSYHYVIVNDQIKEAVEKLKSVIIAERCRKNKDKVYEDNLKRWEEKNG